MNYGNLTILALFVFAYSAVSGRADRTPINGALVYTLFGLALGAHGLGLLELSVESEGLRTLAELTLALVLFTDAANADLSVLRQTIKVPRRLLLVGLPLTIILGFLCGVLLFDDLGLFEIAVLATMLAPTDAALGKAVVTNPRVPPFIRQGLSAESGLNDGICVPILLLFLALASGAATAETTPMLALKLVLEELGIGLLVGLGLTLIMAYLLRGASHRGWVEESWLQLPVVTMALGCFAAAQWLGGSGFIAAFSGGLLFGRLAQKEKPELLMAAEGTGDTLALLTWVVFGAGVVGNYFQLINWQVICYAALSLTVVRMLPVYLCLAGTGPTRAEKLFIGWFGPRGLASIVFGVIVLNENLPGTATISLTVVCTILLSVVAHGLTANPLAARLASKESSEGRPPTG
ncbi:cation:proton antiporter [Microbulbifer marinus]|uniref:Sodium/proton antiporter, CPA1 family n=1 Tax=Microbulbifer marinus TaxID=658218 RepID=A0A1H3VMP9_9GAMM|nr:cation:proton antiporter [Microbulbifer marinus]SDZ76065.1 sodium/proton antiporter, CPA1 family [Microbulbifer marinus]